MVLLAVLKVAGSPVGSEIYDPSEVLMIAKGEVGGVGGLGEGLGGFGGLGLGGVGKELSSFQMSMNPCPYSRSWLGEPKSITAGSNRLARSSREVGSG